MRRAHKHVTVIVQTCPERRGARDETLASLEASDIGTNYTLLEHPPGLTRRDFFAEVLRTMSEAETEWVIRFEDDVVPFGAALWAAGDGNPGCPLLGHPLLTLIREQQEAVERGERRWGER